MLVLAPRRRSRSLRPLADARRAAVAFATALVFAVLAATPASAWWNDNWTLRKKIAVDTSATGAAINDEIGGAPVLVRLHAGNFRFPDAKEDGSDLVFVSGDDKTPLKHHVEKFDPLLSEALIWVRPPDLKPGAKIELWLYYGNEKAQSAADAKGTFDANAALVYHFAEKGTAPQDSTVWANTATTAGQPAEGAIIGTGLRLDGSPVTLPASPSLALQAGGDFTWSAWIKPTALQPNAAIYSRRDAGGALVIGLDNGVPFVEITANGATQRSAPAAPIAAGAWRQIAVTASPGFVTLYLDGAFYGTLAASLPALETPATMGGDQVPPPSAVQPAVPAEPVPAAGPAPGAPVAPAAPPAQPAAVGPALAAFVGEIDELRISKVARPSGFVLAEAISQGPDHGKLVSFGVDEENASWLTGHFGILMKAVTLDGWIVIGVLAVMAALSWIVAIGKNAYLGRQRKANRRFAAWIDGVYAAGEEPGEPGDEKGGRAMKRRSSLYRLHRIAREEVRRRAAKSPDKPLVLTPPTISAIRAALDAQLVREIQQINKQTVILTISIAGGPYLGLLGTVVGVMITFAAIAETGDVNIAAIAPGVAGALVATVAGLLVAIPALFIYNFFNSRIRDLTTDMQVFADGLVTRIAEAYQAPTVATRGPSTGSAALVSQTPPSAAAPTPAPSARHHADPRPLPAATLAPQPAE